MLFSALCSASHFTPLLPCCSTSLLGNNRCCISFPQPQSSYRQQFDSTLTLSQSSRFSLLPIFASSESPPSPSQLNNALSDRQGADVEQAPEDEEKSSSDACAELDSSDGIEIEVTKIGRNRRRVQARADVAADLETVWGVLTDYEGLADFIPSLAVSQLVEKGDGYARLYQVGEQDLALGLKFNAKGVLDCYEKDPEVLPSGRQRNIEFIMVEGDFQTFKGVWSIVQADCVPCEAENLVEVQQGFQTILSYTVELEPKLWLPVRLIEGRLCKEVRINISSIRQEAERIQTTAIPSTYSI